MNTYYLDGAPLDFLQLIKAAEDEGYDGDGGLLTTSEAAEFLRASGHDVTDAPIDEGHTEMKFGDIVENGWASESNPQRIGIYIRDERGGKEALFTDGRGNFWQTGVNDNSKLSIKGSILASVQKGEKDE